MNSIHKKDIDFVLLFSILALICIGITGIYSAEYSEGSNLNFQKQIIWSLVSFVIFFVIQIIPPKFIYYLTNLFYIGLIIILIVVLVFGSVHMGAKRWLHIGDFQFQPSEPGKLILVFILAKYYSASKVDWYDKKNLIIGGILTFIPTFLIFKQPDLGTSLVYPVIFFAILFGAGIPIFFLINLISPILFIVSRGIDFQLFITLLIIYAFFLYKFGKNYLQSGLLWCMNFFVGISSSMVWDKLKPYQKSRILTFLDPERYLQSGGWQVVQSKIAIANGNLFGEGFLKGSQTQLRFLPEGHTDFIFSVISEEFGHIGILFLFLFSFLIIYRGCKIALSCSNKFYYLLSIGIISIFIYQIFINIGMTIGIMPVTGLPLPFLSYGGSSMILNMVTLGILHSIHLHRRDI